MTDALPNGVGNVLDIFNQVTDIGDLVQQTVSAAITTVPKVLMPDFLKHATVKTLTGLVGLPNVASAGSWENVAKLRLATTWIAAGVLPCMMLFAAIRETASAQGHPITALTRGVSTAGLLIAYPWLAGRAISAVNVITTGLLSTSAVGDGLQRAIGVLFGAAIIAGAASPFLCILALLAIVLACLLYAMHVGLLMAVALLYVAGPLAIALYPVRATAHFTRLWVFAFAGFALIPIGWCLIFAVAGALTLDATNLSDLGQFGDTKITAAFAGLLMFVIAFAWPKMIVGQAAGLARRFGINPTASLRGLRTSSAGAKVSPQAAMSSTKALRDGALTVAGGLGAAAGALGAPAGGLIGLSKEGRSLAGSVPGLGALNAAPEHAKAAQSIRGDSSGEGELSRFGRARQELAAIPGALAQAFSGQEMRAGVAGRPPDPAAAADRVRQAAGQQRPSTNPGASAESVRRPVPDVVDRETRAPGRGPASSPRGPADQNDTPQPAKSAGAGVPLPPGRGEQRAVGSRTEPVNGGGRSSSGPRPRQRLDAELAPPEAVRAAAGSRTPVAPVPSAPAGPEADRSPAGTSASVAQGAGVPDVAAETAPRDREAARVAPSRNATPTGPDLPRRESTRPANRVAKPRATASSRGGGRSGPPRPGRTTTRPPAPPANRAPEMPQPRPPHDPPEREV